jgi:hypothetical protein
MTMHDADMPPKPEPGDAARDPVDRLFPYMSGVWLVTTGRTQHVWDLDAGAY